MEAYQKAVQKYRYRLHIDGHIMPDAVMLENFDPAEYIRKSLETGADSLCFHAKCHYGYSYYPTRIGHIHPGLKGRDLYGMLAQELRKQAPDCGLFAYYTLLFSPVDSDLHPDWAAQDQQKAAFAEEHVKGEWLVMCFHGPYRDVVFQQFAELQELYNIDGGFLDFSRSAGVCRCPRCQEAYGKPIPHENDPDWADYCRWKLRDNDQFVKDLEAFLRKKNPAFILLSNYCYGIRQPRPVPPGTALLTEDVGEGSRLSGAQESLDARYLSSLDTPAEIMTTVQLHWWRDWGFKSEDRLRVQNAVISLLGCRVNLAEIPYPDYSIHTNVLDLFRKVFDQSKEIDRILEGAVQMPDMLVLYGGKEYYAKPRPENDSIEHLNLLCGVHNLLQQSRIHYLIVNEDGVKKWNSVCKSILLADQEHVDDAVLEILEEMKKQGKQIYLLGRSLLNPRLQKMAGLKNVRRAGNPFAFFEQVNGEPLIVYAPAYEAETEPGTKVSMKIREGFFSELAFYTGAPVGPCRYPALTDRENVHAMLLPAHESAITKMNPKLRKFFAEWCAGNSFCCGKSSPRVELMVWKREKEILVGLAGHAVPLAFAYNSDMRIPYVIDEIEPVRDLHLAFRCGEQPSAVQTVSGKCTWTWQNGILHIGIDFFHIWDVVTIQVP